MTRKSGEINTQIMFSHNRYFAQSLFDSVNLGLCIARVSRNNAACSLKNACEQCSSMCLSGTLCRHGFPAAPALPSFPFPPLCQLPCQLQIGWSLIHFSKTASNKLPNHMICFTLPKCFSKRCRVVTFLPRFDRLSFNEKMANVLMTSVDE